MKYSLKTLKADISILVYALPKRALKADISTSSFFSLALLLC